MPLFNSLSSSEDVDDRLVAIETANAYEIPPCCIKQLLMILFEWLFLGVSGHCRCRMEHLV